MWRKWELRLKRGAILLLLFALVVDALPPLGSAHENLQDDLDWIYDKTGLWQGRWKLFAPNVDKVNVAVSADLTYEDGTIQHWRSPDWSKMNGFVKHRYFRHMEYFDSIRLDKYKAAWRPFAIYLARSVPHPKDSNIPVVHVKLTRHWVNIPPPDKKKTYIPVPKHIPLNQEYVFWEQDIP